MALFCASLAELELCFPEFPSLYISGESWLQEKSVWNLEAISGAAAMILMLQALRQHTHSASSQAEMAPGSAALLAPTRTTLASPLSGSSTDWVKCSLGQVRVAPDEGCSTSCRAPIATRLEVVKIRPRF